MLRKDRPEAKLEEFKYGHSHLGKSHHLNSRTASNSINLMRANQCPSSQAGLETADHISTLHYAEKCH